MSISGVGAAATVPVVPPRLLQIDTIEQAQALTRIAITPDVTAAQLAVAMGISVDEVAGLVEVYQAALRSLLTAAGFWLPTASEDADLAAAVPFVAPRSPSTGALRPSVPPVASEGAAAGATAAGADQAGPEHLAYQRALSLRAQLGSAEPVEAPTFARIAIQVGQGPARLLFLLDETGPTSQTSVHAAIPTAAARAEGGAGVPMVVAEVSATPTGAFVRDPGPAAPAAPATAPTDVAGATAAPGATAQEAAAAARGAATTANAAGTGGDAAAGGAGQGSAATAAAGAAATAGAAGTADDAQAPDVAGALKAAQKDPVAGYRAWPGRPSQPTPIAPQHVDEVARQAAPTQPPVVLGDTPTRPAEVRDLLVAAARDGGGPATLVADGRAIPAAIELAARQPEAVARLVLDLTAILRATIEAAAREAAPPGPPPVDPGRLAEVLAASTLGRGEGARRKRKRRSGGGDEPEPPTDLAEDFFAALFSIRVSDQLKDVQAPITIVAPDLEELEGLADALGGDLVDLTVRLTDLPAIEVLEILRDE